MSGAEDSTAKLFARASSLLIGAKADAIGDHDAREMLRALDYAVSESAAPSEGISPETANRAHLLDVASRVARVFELAAPDAPGLIAFGAQFDPVLADPLHQGSPLVGVSGVGLSLQQAFQSCIGEAVEYLSQLHNQSDALLEPGIGSAAGPSREAAALHGLLELIERDAVSLWWRGGQFGRSIPPQHPAAVAAEDLMRQLRHGASVPRRTWLLDITTDIAVPEAYCLDLTRPHFAVPVMRVIAPGLQLEPFEIVTTRLRYTMARTGGGATYTGGVAMM